ncbi:MAG: hypothetical protein LQ350_003560 [Teloschistes chrysophthalmus]|nr:MAG: hypothetical protein LQ350_003560 [Niorma chrysophthalma]
MASSGVNVLRYSALLGGISYGLYHQSSLDAKRHKAHVEQEFRQQESLITQAKAEFKKKNMPAESITKGGQVISDPEDPKFDLEGYLTALMGEKAK